MNIDIVNFGEEVRMTLLSSHFDNLQLYYLPFNEMHGRVAVYFACNSVTYM